MFNCLINFNKLSVHFWGGNGTSCGAAGLNADKPLYVRSHLASACVHFTLVPTCINPICNYMYMYAYTYSMYVHVYRGVNTSPAIL